MKKILLFLIILLSFNTVEAETKLAGEKTDYYYSTTTKAIQEVMKAYYLRGINIQYHSRRGKIPGLSPENATTQDNQYQVCANYYYDVFYETFGMYNNAYESKEKVKHPIASSLNCIDQAKEYYDKIKSGKATADGHYLLYYENTCKDGKNNVKNCTKEKYIYGSKNNEMDIKDFAKMLQPGDIIAWKAPSTSGHVEIVYDVIKDSKGQVIDALILGSGGGTHVLSRLDETASGLRYSYYPNVSKTGIVDVPLAGTVRTEYLIGEKTNRGSDILIDANDSNVNKKGSYTKRKLTDYDNTNNNMMSCAEQRCMVLRPFYNKDNKTVFNYDINTESYLRSFLRTKYPGMMIEKTVDKLDNNSVYLGDTLQYTIKITNKSSATYNRKDQVKYDKFTIKEEINTKLVDYISNDSKCTIDSSKKILTCIIDGLEADKTKTIKYSVKVKDTIANIGKSIDAVGKVYGDPAKYADLKTAYITTGTVSNTIIRKLSDKTSDKPKDSYKNCFNRLSNKFQGRELINEIYKCAWGKDYDYKFDSFDFNNLIRMTDTSTNLYGDEVFYAVLKSLDELKYDVQYYNFRRMVLNRYWSSIVTIPKFESNVRKVAVTYLASSCKCNIVEKDFKDGDVLIYYTDYKKGPYGEEYNIDQNNVHTKEKGYYAYIFLDGKFQGINYKGEDNERNEFTYKYYYNTYGKKDDKDAGYKHLYQYFDRKNLQDSIKNGGITNEGEIEKEVERILKRANYETLYEKNSYVILRPEIMIAKEQTEISGDVDGNGIVNEKDYKLIRLHTIKISKLSGDKLRCADVNGDDKINAADYNIIRRKLLKFI